MKFKDFLNNLKVKKNLRTIRDLYEVLGGEEQLEMSIRHFQHICSGKYAPTVTTVAAIFQNIELEDRKDLILSFFESSLGRNSKSKSFFDFLSLNLSPPVNLPKSNIWESNQHQMFYSEDQLNFLKLNPAALKFHKKVLLFNKVPRSSCKIDPLIVSRLVELELVKLVGHNYVPTRNIYRIPTYENSSSKSVIAGTNYLIKFLESFTTKTGSETQKISTCLQLVKIKNAEKILEQSLNFQKWIQSTAEVSYSGEEVPLAYLNFTKILDLKDFD